MIEENNIWLKILRLVKKHQLYCLSTWKPCAEVLDRNTDLVSDLKFDIESAKDFLEDLAELFPNLNADNFSYTMYFKTGIAWELFPTGAKELDKQAKRKLTLGMLEQAVIDGIWDSEKLEIYRENSMRSNQ